MNKAEFEQYNNFVVQGSKLVFDKKDGKPYNVGVHLQIFTDDEGKPVMIREV